LAKPCANTGNHLTTEYLEVDAQGVVHDAVVNSRRCGMGLDKYDTRKRVLRMLRGSLMQERAPKSVTRVAIKRGFLKPFLYVFPLLGRE
jgi:hypothetical protein